MEQLLTHLHHLEQGWTCDPALSAIKTRVHRCPLHISGQDEGAFRTRRAVRGCSRQADLRGVRGSLKTPLTAACSQSDLCAEFLIFFNCMHPADTNKTYLWCSNVIKRNVLKFFKTNAESKKKNNNFAHQEFFLKPCQVPCSVNQMEDTTKPTTPEKKALFCHCGVFCKAETITLDCISPCVPILLQGLEEYCLKTCETLRSSLLQGAGASHCCKG